MVKKTFVSLLQWTKLHNEKQSPRDFKRVIQNSSAQIVGKVLRFGGTEHAQRLECSCHLKYSLRGLPLFQFAGGIGSNDRAEELQDELEFRGGACQRHDHPRAYSRVQGQRLHSSCERRRSTIEIKSSKTDHIAFHKGSALTKLGN